MSSIERVTPGPDPRSFLALLDALVAVRTTRSQMDALESRLFAACAEYADAAMSASTSRDHHDAEIIWRSLSMELGAALMISDRTVRAQMDQAASLAERFPGTKDAWEHGAISTSHVREITAAGQQIDDAEARAEYERRVLEIAPSETAARTKAIARVIASRIEPDVVARRVRAAAETRAVWVEDLDDGVSKVCAILPATLAHGILDRLQQASQVIRHSDSAAAKAATTTDRDPGMRRRADQIRADLFADLLLTGTPSACQVSDMAPDRDEARSALSALRGRVQVIVTADALFGDSNDAPVLAGAGVIAIEDARAIAAATPAWDRLTIDPARNTLTAVERYRPSEEQRRILHALDEHCRRPGCRRPAADCDLDHSLDWAKGGKTTLFNLANLCRADHTVKHADGWTITRKEDGTLLWTSKHGRVYPDLPRPAVAFMISTPPPF